jgi:deoxyribodipyrimidine photo-lyase
LKKTFPSKELNEQLVLKYGEQRHLPPYNGPSKLGVHLRFGTVSIRQIAKQCSGLSENIPE